MPLSPHYPLRAAVSAGRALTLALSLTAAPAAQAAAAGTQRLDDGAWSASIPADPAQPCELTTGGYNRAVGEQQPLLLIVIERGDPDTPLRVNVLTNTDLSQPELLRANALLRVDGPRARSLPLVPSAIVETDRERRVTFRPQPAGGEQAGLRGLVEAMRDAGRVTVEINGLALEPAFAMRGLDALWQQAAPRCGLGP